MAVKGRFGRTPGTSVLGAMAPTLPSNVRAVSRDPLTMAAKPAMFPAERGPNDKEFTQISRGALEGLVAQVPGMTMEWNDGNPHFTQHGEKLGLQGGGKWMKVSEAGPERGTAADKAAAERLMARMPAAPKVQSGMSYRGITIDEIGWKVANISGLNDLLKGDAPATVTAAPVSGGIQRIIDAYGAGLISNETALAKLAAARRR